MQEKLVLCLLAWHHVVVEESMVADLSLMHARLSSTLETHSHKAVLWKQALQQSGDHTAEVMLQLCFSVWQFEIICQHQNLGHEDFAIRSKRFYKACMLKVASVLLTSSTASSAHAHLSFCLASWHYCVLEDKQVAELSLVNARIASTTETHRRDVSWLKQAFKDVVLRQTVLHMWYATAIQNRDLMICKTQSARVQEHVDFRSSMLIDAACAKWGEFDAALLLRHVLVAWGLDTAVERETRCREVLLYREDAVNIRRENAIDALGRSRLSSFLQDIYSVWHHLAGLTSISRDSKALSDEQLHHLMVALIASEHRAQEALDHRTLSSNLVDALHLDNDGHGQKMEELEQEVELLHAQLAGAQMRVRESAAMTERSVLAIGGSVTSQPWEVDLRHPQPLAMISESGNTAAPEIHAVPLSDPATPPHPVPPGRSTPPQSAAYPKALGQRMRGTSSDAGPRHGGGGASVASSQQPTPGRRHTASKLDAAANRVGNFRI
jgi:hypothetical protein